MGGEGKWIFTHIFLSTSCSSWLPEDKSAYDLPEFDRVGGFRPDRHNPYLVRRRNYLRKIRSGRKSANCPTGLLSDKLTKKNS